MDKYSKLIQEEFFGFVYYFAYIALVDETRHCVKCQVRNLARHYRIRLSIE